MGMAKGSGYSAEDIMQSVTIAIGAGLTPSGPDLWSQPVDQTGLDQRSAHWDEWTPRPEDRDRVDFGTNFKEHRWGEIRIVMTGEGYYGALVRRLGGGGDNATTFSANLIVFSKPLDLSQPRHREWLMHELRHVMQAQQLGVAYLPKYIAMWALFGYVNHPMELDANAFANGSGLR
jgi:hypothetical protein